jgi:hypothetical protein
MLRKREMTLEGILVPRRWNASGEVAGLTLNTLDEREYVIEDPGCEARVLLKHLRKQVRLTGTVIGNRVVHVTAVSTPDSLGTPQS